METTKERKDSPAESLLTAGASMLPETMDAKAGTVDCVWYTGVPVMRQNWSGNYMLRLDMAGCRMERLNAGAPVFDTHFNGNDYASIEAGMAGTKAQRGVVKKAWTDGSRGMATLQFDMDNPDAVEMFRKIGTGQLRNLSPGTFIYDKQKEPAPNPPPKINGEDVDQFVATDWEPFELSVCTVPADFDTDFLAAGRISEKETSEGSEKIRIAKAIEEYFKPFIEKRDAGATSPINKETVMETQEKPAGGGPAPIDNKVALEAARAEGANLERQRMTDIRTMGATHKLDKLAEKLIIDGVTADAARARFQTAAEIKLMGSQMKKHGVTEEFTSSLIDQGLAPDQARQKIFEQLAASGQQSANGRDFPIQSEVQLSRDGADTQFSLLKAAVMLRADRHFLMARKRDARGEMTGEFLAGCGPEQQRKLEDLGREYQSFSLIEMARVSLQLRGINTRGMDKMTLATRALLTRPGSQEILSGDGGMETTTDFPGVLADVANKTLRQAFESYPQTFKPFCKQATAPDFKNINRMQLNDLYALPQMNEKGEFHRANLTDSKINYKLAPFGGIVAITRTAIINDDMTAFTRTPMELGRAAVTTQSNLVWGLITNNTQVMQDGNVLFHTAHKNKMTGAGSVFGLGAAEPPTGLALARATMRQQKAPGGTPLNLIGRFLCVGTNLETPAAQALAPINIASSDVTKVVPEWVRGMVLIVEPRLDPATGSNYPWLVIADPSQIDTIEYCFLEGQEGVYFETRQGFEVDGVEMKARMDFAAAAIEQRGMVYAAGA